MIFTKGNVCSAINCSNNRKKTPHLSFFRFPKDPERSKKWLINGRRQDLLQKDVVYLHNNVKFCALHFESNQFMSAEKKKLVWNAVPTLFDVPNKPQLVMMKTKLPYKHESVTAKTIKLSPDTEETATTSVTTRETHIKSLTTEFATQTSFEDEMLRLREIIRVWENRVTCKNVQIIRLRTKLLCD
ncbi:52 kDa repressor of the inhibitor of the protein kinase [Schistocerca cancellata]|uniref:52 kDa repressor of the inhibitor of the protein kinase n=1 Tax=Schistocerca cancellata TaxID=274614 RepID=UPI0021187A79|nr:52 kDa repressor of the inhibitor of the protein kinase [Schistocerca cancellata]